MSTGGKLKAGFIIHWYRDRAVVSSVKHRNSHSVHVSIGNSLTPQVALLVLPSGTVYPVVDRHEFTGSVKSCL